MGNGRWKLCTIISTGPLSQCWVSSEDLVLPFPSELLYLCLRTLFQLWKMCSLSKKKKHITTFQSSLNWTCLWERLDQKKYKTLWIISSLRWFYTHLENTSCRFISPSLSHRSAASSKQSYWLHHFYESCFPELFPAFRRLKKEWHFKVNVCQYWVIDMWEGRIKCGLSCKLSSSCLFNV